MKNPNCYYCWGFLFYGFCERLQLNLDFSLESI